MLTGAAFLLLIHIIPPDSGTAPHREGDILYPDSRPAMCALCVCAAQLLSAALAAGNVDLAADIVRYVTCVLWGGTAPRADQLNDTDGGSGGGGGGAAAGGNSGSQAADGGAAAAAGGGSPPPSPSGAGGRPALPSPTTRDGSRLFIRMPSSRGSVGGGGSGGGGTGSGRMRYPGVVRATRVMRPSIGDVSPAVGLGGDALTLWPRWWGGFLEGALSSFVAVCLGEHSLRRAMAPVVRLDLQFVAAEGGACGGDGDDDAWLRRALDCARRELLVPTEVAYVRCVRVCMRARMRVWPARVRRVRMHARKQ